MVNSCLKKLKFHLASFDMVVKERTTTIAITEGTWGFKHTKACFRDDIIPFVKALKELFISFDQCLIDEVTEVQKVFKQIEQAVEQHFLKLRKNRRAHTDYIRHTQEEAATLREIIESERLLSPLNTSLDYACKYIRRIQELLIILQQTCPCLTDLGTKLVAVTPKNKTNQIRLIKQITKSGKTTVTTPPAANIDSNTPVLSSAGVTLVSSASGSMIATSTIVPPRELIPIVNSIDKPVVTLVYSRKTKAANKKVPVVQIVLWYLDSGCSKHMTGDRSQLVNFVQKFLGTKQPLYSVSTRYDGVLPHLSFVQGIQDQVLALALPVITSELWCY
nr:hypothetical protein [Tanacetum cinerariifolium]